MTLSWELREIGLDDMRVVFELRNDPYIVERSSSRKPIGWAEHDAWFSKSVEREDQLAFLIDSLEEKKSVGVIRFERVSEADAVISVYMIERFTRRGIGVEVIRSGCERAFSRWKISRVLANVRKDNVAGQKGFRKAGFHLLDDPVDSGHDDLHQVFFLGRYLERGAL